MTAVDDDPGQIKRALIDASAGAISGAVSRTVTSPLDVIKIRFQVSLIDKALLYLRIFELNVLVIIVCYCCCLGYTCIVAA